MCQLKIRDFIYLDIDRLKSIIAQVEQGLANTSSGIKTNSKEASSNIEGSLLGFLKSVGGAKFVWQNQTTETKTLHDNIYNKVENILINNNSLICIPEQINLQGDIAVNIRSQLNDTAFILSKGKVNINDFSKMRTMIENHNEMMSFLAECSASTLPTETPEKIRYQTAKNLKQKGQLSNSFLNGLKLMFDLFYKDRIIIKMLPFTNSPNIRLVGNLNQTFLRDDISSIIYKYGTSPLAEWKIFGQIASIPLENHSNTNQLITGAPVEVALQNMFDAFRGIELITQSVVYPEIAITPIAIYRE